MTQLPKLLKKIYKDCSWQGKVARLTIKNHRYSGGQGPHHPPPNDASVVGSHYATASKCALRTSRCRLQPVQCALDLWLWMIFIHIRQITLSISPQNLQRSMIIHTYYNGVHPTTLAMKMDQMVREYVNGEYARRVSQCIGDPMNRAPPVDVQSCRFLVTACQPVWTTWVQKIDLCGPSGGTTSKSKRFFRNLKSREPCLMSS